MNFPNIREIVQLTISFRQAKGYLYLPGALNRVVAAVEQQMAGLSPHVRVNRERFIDIIEECILSEEKPLWQLEAIGPSIALPGWREWAQHAGALA